MSVVTTANPDQPLCSQTLPMYLINRLPLFWELTKPRIVSMVIVATTVGYISGAHFSIRPLSFMMTLLGTSLFAGSASVLNQVIEKNRDALMHRTALRPLPSGRIDFSEALIFGLLLFLSASLLLVLFVNWLSFWFAFATWFLYLCVYTPLKPVSSVNTIVGAVPGALPPVIGWAGATGEVGLEALSMFLILFLWQFPHFLAIAWLYREDYRRGGYRMITSDDLTGYKTGFMALGYSTVLIPVSVLPFQIHMAGTIYLVASLLLSLYYWLRAVEFLRDRTDQTARRLLFASLWYLPLVYLFLILNPLPA